MNIVTGHKGFIGSHLFKKLPKSIGVEQDDAFKFLNEFNDWKKVDCVYHMGGISSTTETDLGKIFLNNVHFTQRLFEKCIQYKIPVKYASSASVYGNQYPNINPLNYYSLSKATIDFWVMDNITKFSNIVGYRFFNVYGRNEKHKEDQASVVYQFMRQCEKKKPIKVFRGSENYIRDFICVEDVVNVILSFQKPSAIYDLGTSNPISFMDVANKIANRFDGTIQYMDFPHHLVRKYQYTTCARKEFDYNFMTVDEWLDHHSPVQCGTPKSA